MACILCHESLWHEFYAMNFHDMNSMVWNLCFEIFITRILCYEIFITRILWYEIFITRVLWYEIFITRSLCYEIFITRILWYEISWHECWHEFLGVEEIACNENSYYDTEKISTYHKYAFIQRNYFFILLSPMAPHRYQ